MVNHFSPLSISHPFKGFAIQFLLDVLSGCYKYLYLKLAAHTCMHIGYALGVRTYSTHLFKLSRMLPVIFA